MDAFDYDYPRALVAQRPAPERSASRMMLVDRRSARIEHRFFVDFPTYLAPGDVLVVNSSRVFKARLTGTRENGRPAEVLLVHPQGDGTWLAMVHPGGKLKVGRRIAFGPAGVEVVEVLGGGLRRLELRGTIDWSELIAQFGTVPLPPYIQRSAEPVDERRYQTVYARAEGSVAAPTAGLHFTEQILTDIERVGVTVVEVILHVGPGTFKPVQVDDPAKHHMHAEWYTLSAGAADAVNRARDRGGRIWAVGTTVTRVLETVGGTGPLHAGEGWTDLFIYPPYRFHTVDAMLTNFHLPRSTLLMLTCAFGGYDLVMEAYRSAVAARYRVFSYGDVMAIT